MPASAALLSPSAAPAGVVANFAKDAAAEIAAADFKSSRRV
jgi:hypothetical protein